MFKVTKEKCSQCLFSPNKIVSNQRRRELLADIKQADSHFVCHKHDDVCCRGFYDSSTSNLIRISQRLGMIEEVDTEETK